MSMNEDKVNTVGQWVAVVLVISVGALALTVVAGLIVQTARWLF